jgi:hypothetical protein
MEQAQDAAHRRAKGSRPDRGVLEADHERAILEDQRRSESRIAAESDDRRASR